MKNKQYRVNNLLSSISYNMYSLNVNIYTRSNTNMWSHSEHFRKHGKLLCLVFCRVKVNDSKCLLEKSTVTAVYQYTAVTWTLHYLYSSFSFFLLHIPFIAVIVTIYWKHRRHFVHWRLKRTYLFVFKVADTSFHSKWQFINERKIWNKIFTKRDIIVNR